MLVLQELMVRQQVQVVQGVEEEEELDHQVVLVQQEQLILEVVEEVEQMVEQVEKGL